MGGKSRRPYRGKGAWRSRQPRISFTIAGSGVETDKMTPLPGAAGTGDHGRSLAACSTTREFVRLLQLMKSCARGQPVRLLIAGEPDPANPASIPRFPCSELRPDWRGRARPRLTGVQADHGAQEFHELQ